MKGSPRKRRENQHLSIEPQILLKDENILQSQAILFDASTDPWPNTAVFPFSPLISPLLTRRCSMYWSLHRVKPLYALPICIQMEWLLFLSAAWKQSKESFLFIDFENPKGFEIMPLPFKPEGWKPRHRKLATKKTLFESIHSAIQNRSAECVPLVLAFHSH